MVAIVSIGVSACSSDPTTSPPGASTDGETPPPNDLQPSGSKVDVTTETIDVEGTTRDAGDLDFRVLLAEDACAAMSAVGHQNALAYLDANFCHVRSTEQILALLGAPAAAAVR